MTGINSTLNIQGTSFAGNKALNFGGVIGVQQQVHLCIMDCKFVDNHGRNGGAINGDFFVVLEVSRSYFVNNSASDEGGAINVQQNSDLSLTNCGLEGNYARIGGGAILAIMNVTLEIRETNFTGYNATTYGGALWGSQSKCYLVKCVFHGNAVEGIGGAL